MSNIYAELGEGIHIDKGSNSIYWVDINNNILFVATPVTVNSYKLDKQVSGVLCVKNNIIHLASSDGIVFFDVETCSLSLLGKIPDFFSSESYRSNDAVMISDGIYFYGVMDKSLDTTGAIVV